MYHLCPQATVPISAPISDILANSRLADDLSALVSAKVAAAAAGTDSAVDVTAADVASALGERLRRMSVPVGEVYYSSV